MRAFSTLVLAACTWLALGSQAFADVTISIHDGLVSLSAKDATVRQILTEWARVGRTRIVNVERIAGAPITIELTNVPEQEALDLLMRSLSGYLVAPRAPIVSDASQFDKIIVLPAAASPRPAVSAAAAPPPAPFGQLNGIMPTPEDDDNRPGGPQLPPALSPIFNNVPQPNPNNPQQNPRRPGNTQPPSPGPGLFGAVPQNDPQVAPPGPVPPGPQPTTSPFGAVSAPGMIAPAASQPGQVVPQGPPGPQPGQVVPQAPQGPQQRRPNDN
jgi:hypothetical protein